MNAVHRSLFLAVVLEFSVLFIWGVVQWIRGQEPSGSYRGALVLGQVLILAEALVGVLLVLTGHHPKDGLHWLYGAVLLLALPVAFGLGSQRSARARSLYYAIGALLIVIIAVVRSSMTG